MMDQITDQFRQRLAALLEQAGQDRAAVQSADLPDGVVCYDRLSDSLTKVLENLNEREVPQ